MHPAAPLSEGTSAIRLDVDETALWAQIEAATDALDQRRVVVTTLKAVRNAAFAHIADTLAAAPHASRPVTHAYSDVSDRTVTTALRAACRISGAPLSVLDSIAVIAVGGSGRGEMALHSDVDLLFLTPRKAPAPIRAVVQELLYILWDLKLKVGHATRTIKDCLTLGREDYTIRTALVENRLLAGDPALRETLNHRLRGELFKNTASDFIETKLEERATRHQRQGGQRYVVEPNVKEAKGGLRDLQSLFWIAKYVNGVSDAAELVDLGLFTAPEFDTFVAAEDFLWAVRCHLHIITNRTMDQLTFDLQVEVAGRMGYKPSGGRRAVEHFMQDYFRHATRVGELTRIFLTALEAAHVKKAPSLTRIFKRPPPVGKGYTVQQNRLAIADETQFARDKLNILRVFAEGLRTGLLLHPDTMRLIAAHLHLIDQDLRHSDQAVALFKDLLLKHGNPERSLRRMNELGVLAAFIPEFEAIVAMMQFNMYHSYTVDEHTIQTIGHLARIERGELIEELPIASGILDGGVNRWVLYVALLLHDIGKGRSEDHSILGAKIARKVAPRLGLDTAEAETVEWLVRHHLLMSDMAQKRDIADPRTVRDFAKAVGTVRRLDLLTVLTVCDISAVGPETWNNWKAVLIRALYRQTRHALENGLEDLTRQNREAEAHVKLRGGLARLDQGRRDDGDQPPLCPLLAGAACDRPCKVCGYAAEPSIR